MFKTSDDGEVQIACEEKGFDEKVYELIKVGIDTATEISQEMGCSPATISRAAHRMIQRKLIHKSGRKYVCSFLPGGRAKG
jgi:predicted transcriptional regulator